MDNKSKRVYDRSNKPANISKKKSSFSLRKPNKAANIIIYGGVCVGLIALTCALNIALYNNVNNPPISSSSATTSNIRKDNSSVLDINSTVESDKASSSETSGTASQDSSSDTSSEITSSEAAPDSSSSSSQVSSNETSQATSSAGSSSSSGQAVIDDDGTNGEYDGSIYIYKNSGYELFYGSDATAKNYAKAISEFKKLVGNNVNVYNLIVPNHSEFALPERIKNDAGVTSQYQNINTLFNSYTEDVKGINIYDIMNEHKNEYTYFNTDHHWTALGAYYAYTQFATDANLKPISLNDTKKGQLENFEGSFINATGGNSILKNNLDTVYYYEIPGNQKCTIVSDDGEAYDASLLYPYEILPENSYSVFIWGDNPFMTIKTDNHNGKKLMVVKESYGNAIVPFLAANYEEIYVVDFRYYTDGIVSLVKDNDIDDVLFLNGIISANTTQQVNKIKALFK